MSHRHVPLNDLADRSRVSRRLIRQVHEDEVRVTHSSRFSSHSQGGDDGCLLAVSQSWQAAPSRRCASCAAGSLRMHHLVIPLRHFKSPYMCVLRHALRLAVLVRTCHLSKQCLASTLPWTCGRLCNKYCSEFRRSLQVYVVTFTRLQCQVTWLSQVGW